MRARRRGRRRWVVATVVAVLLVGALALVSAVTGNTTPRGPGSSAELVGRHVQGFTLSGLNGGSVHAPWNSGHPSVLLFFASYCLPCQGEMPKVAAYVRTHSPSPVDVVAIDAIDERSSAQAMVRRDGVTFPVAIDPNGAVTDGDFGFGQVPESVLVNARGVVTRVYYGAIPVTKLARGIATLKTST